MDIGNKENLMEWEFLYTKDGIEYKINRHVCLCEDCARKIIIELNLGKEYRLGLPNKGICRFNGKHMGNIVTLQKFIRKGYE
jgi:hypothetical protein